MTNRLTKLVGLFISILFLGNVALFENCAPSQSGNSAFAISLGSSNPGNSSAASGTGSPSASPTGALSLNFSEPINNSIISTVTAVTVNAVDINPLNSVQFEIDGVNFGGAFAAPPYSISIDPTLVSTGTHIIFVTAVDAAGNLGTASITINVSAPIRSPSPVIPCRTLVCGTGFQ